jgi:hypothetical protein
MVSTRVARWLGAGILVLSTAGCGRSSFRGVDLSPYVPPEYVAPVKDALELSGENAAALLEALKNAPEPDREALAFLISELPPVDLASVESPFLLDTVRLAREARDRFQWGKTVPEDVYLRYVLPPRVSQEPLEAWRPYLLAELAPRLEETTSMEEAALQVNRWCGEHVGFRPTEPRDQGVFETLSSGYGRCEEMMIVHIAALRSVAIPARQAWTPYWPTMDNNHAWTELWVDGTWHYAGACEPADALDKAWFTEPVKGAALVFSSVFGSPAQGDEVYREEDRYAIVNSVRNYLDAGTIVVDVTRDGRPVEAAPVTVSVWNFGALRAISRQETDGAGEVRLSIGDGTYFVCAGGAGGHDWDLARVSAGDTTTVRLALDVSRPFDADFELSYAEKGE